MSVNHPAKVRSRPGRRRRWRARPSRLSTRTGGGFVLRWSTPDDRDRLAAMFANVLRAGEHAPPHHRHGAWVRDMMSGRCPHISGFDFALVEDAETGQIVASACLFANRATYDDLPFTLGRAAIVGTEIPYRSRGLQRAIFELIHARSAQRGHLAQGIAGIRHVYRAFGYEYAIDLEASRHVATSALPPQQTVDGASISLRAAVEADIPLLTALAARERACWQIATVLDPEAWRWMLFGADPTAGNLGTAFIITGAERDIGYLLVDRLRRGDSLGIWEHGGDRRDPAGARCPACLARRERGGAAVARRAGDRAPLARLRLEIGPGHALFDALGPYLAPEHEYRYAWWMRVPDVPAFLQHIRPALERRLARSALAGYSGAVCIDFYRTGVRLEFEQGKLLRAGRGASCFGTRARPAFRRRSSRNCCSATAVFWNCATSTRMSGLRAWSARCWRPSSLPRPPTCSPLS